ncbi:hypothetical protein [Helicobacter sp. NHP19-0012]
MNCATTDNQRAIEYYQRAGEMGDANSFYTLAVMYKNGNGVSHNPQKVAEYYTKTNDMGFSADNWDVCNH